MPLLFKKKTVHLGEYTKKLIKVLLFFICSSINHQCATGFLPSFSITLNINLHFINHFCQVITTKSMKIWSFITKTHGCYDIYGMLIVNRVNNIKWHTCINHPFCYSKITPFDNFVFSTTSERLLSTISCSWHKIYP
jgi:hypothetical protein